jgi:hypothetical protein
MKFLKSQTTSKRSFQTGAGMFYNDSTGVFDLRSNSAMQVPFGSDAQRPDAPQLGMMRFNTDNNSVEFYDNGIWKEVRLKEPTPIHQQDLGTGDGIETVFGALNANDSSYPVPASAQCVLVLVENVLQISTTNYTLEQSVSGNLTGPNAPYADGWYIKFLSPVPSGKNVTVIHNFDK